MPRNTDNRCILLKQRKNDISILRKQCFKESKSHCQ